MARPSIDAARVVSPLQLMAACIVFLVLLEPVLIAGASTIEKPDWAPGVLVLAAVLNVPLLLAFVLFSQARFRDSLLADEKYVEYRRELSINDRRLRQMLDNTDTLESSKVPNPVSEATSLQIGQATVDLLGSAQFVGICASLTNKLIDPELVRNIATGFFVSQRWDDAASYFDIYVDRIGEESVDWRINFSRGVAHANRRAGRSGDLAAFHAYSLAQSAMPNDAPGDLKARVMSYKGSMNKRLGRLDDALRDLSAARRMAATTYETIDITYNFAAVYALKGNRDQAIAELKKLDELGGISLVRPHIEDYFSELRNDSDFRTLVAAPRNSSPELKTLD